MIYLLVFIIGLIFGSFINALVWRLHEQLDANGNPKNLSAKRKNALSISKGRSMCPNCKHELAAKDLVPVFSWLWLSGKCRYCKAPISVQYPLVELLTAVLFAVSWLAWPGDITVSWQLIGLITWLISLVGLVALAIYDIKWMLLPDRILLPLISFVIGSTILQFVLGRPIEDILAIIFTVSITSGLFWILYQVSNGKWIGGGDVKLGLLTGLLIGYPIGGFLYLFFASLLGLAWMLPGLISKKVSMTQHVPFGPFLIASTIVVALFGQTLVNWYTSLFLGT